MRLKYIYLIILFFAGSICLLAQGRIELKFNPNGQFKVAQFTDIHWDPSSPNCAETTATIKYVLETERPDFAILSGDVVTERPAKDGWLAIAKIFEEAKTPWAALMGNHDEEQGYTRKQIFEILEGLPYYIGEAGPDDITGCGNYVLPIKASANNIAAALIYGIDSNDYPKNPKAGHYDWIHFDQMQWFRQIGKKYTDANHDKHLPSLVYFHIPVPEFADIVGKETTIGVKGEGIAGADINSGFFCAMLEQGGVMGAFTGHDHNNDYIGLHHDIALGFGRVTGTDAYGTLDRGSRIVLMYEGRNKFDTWIRTRKGIEFKYYYPSGLSEHDELSMNYLPSLKKKVVKQGLNYTYYEGGRLKKVADIATNTTEKRKGIVPNFTLAPAVAQDSFAFIFDGLIDVPENGVYRFYTNSDDGSQLFIDGILVVDNDGSHNSKRVDGKIALEQGLHKIQVIYFENYMGELLEVGWSSRNIEEQLIPDKLLFHE